MFLIYVTEWSLQFSLTTREKIESCCFSDSFENAKATPIFLQVDSTQ